MSLINLNIWPNQINHLHPPFFILFCCVFYFILFYKYKIGCVKNNIKHYFGKDFEPIWPFLAQPRPNVTLILTIYKLIS